MSRTTNKKEKDDERGVEQRLLKQRIVLLFEEVNETSASEVVQSIIILDSINRRPIKLLINSIGGAISDGLAVIDTMKAVRSPIETFIVGTAMSMAAIISICGCKRYITPNSVWMQHASQVTNEDHIGCVKDRLNWDLRQEKILNNIILEHTALTPRELARINSGELWFSAEETVQKKICDEIVTKFYKEK